MTIQLMTAQEIENVSGANGVIAGPNGEGCIPPIVIGPVIEIPGLEDWLNRSRTVS